MKILAELLRPLSSAFTELWLDGEKAATVEWRKDVDAVPGLDVDREMVQDNGRGIVLDHPVEPLYGDIYMPREFYFTLVHLFIFSVFLRVKEGRQEGGHGAGAGGAGGGRGEGSPYL